MLHRIYCLLKLNFRRKGKQRLPVRNPSPLATPEAPNQSWSVDFMHDALACGRRFRTFNVVDDFNREALSIAIELNLSALRVVRVLDRSAVNRGYPVMLRMDNGPEFISLALAEWAEILASSRVNRRRTLSSGVLTGHTVQKHSIFICSERRMKYGKLRRNGYQNITVNARMNY